MENFVSRSPFPLDLCDGRREGAYPVYDTSFFFDHIRKILHNQPNYVDRKIILQFRPNSLSTIFDLSVFDQNLSVWLCVASFNYERTKIRDRYVPETTITEGKNYHYKIRLFRI